MEHIIIMFTVPRFPKFNKNFDKLFYKKTLREDIDKVVKNLRDEYSCEVTEKIYDDKAYDVGMELVRVDADWDFISD